MIVRQSFTFRRPAKPDLISLEEWLNRPHVAAGSSRSSTLLKVFEFGTWQSVRSPGV